jgi:excisionase family DNA binding protein
MTERLAYSLAEAAQAVGLSVRSLRYLLETGKLGFVKIGRRILIRDEDLQRLLRQGYCRPQGRIDADEPIRPRTQQGLGSHPEASDGPR